MSRLNQLIAIFLAAFLILPPAALDAKNRKGDKLRNEARDEEIKGNFDKALDLAEQAMATDPGDPSYVLEVRRVRFEAGAAHVKTGQKLRGDGKLDEALAEFQKAFGIDPSSEIAEQEIRRTKEMIERNKNGGKDTAEALTPEEMKTLTPTELARKEIQNKIDSLQPAPELHPMNNMDPVKMSNQTPRVLFETVGKLAGVNVLFDPEYTQQQTIAHVSVDLTSRSLEEDLDQLALVTKSFWKPLSSNTIFVSVDNPTKRRELAEQVVKVFYLSNVTGPQEMQEILTVLRTVLDVQKVFNYTAQSALVVRTDADTMALVEKMISALDKPKGECIIDVMVMEVSSSYMRTLSAGGIGANGINTAAVFAPRPGITTPGLQTATSSTTSTTGTTTTTGTTSTTGTTGTSSTTGTTSVTQVPFSELGHISSADFSITTLPGAQFEAILNDSSTRVLQAPQIRATDNIKASIHIGEKVPTASGSFQPGVAGVGVSPLVNTQFTYLEVGVNVDLLPKIHENGDVSAHMEIDVSQVDNYDNLGGISEPVIGQNKATADVTLKDGVVSLIGGIIQDTNSKAITGIPGLANIPLFGRLFNSENLQKNKTELLIALIPHVVRIPYVTASDLQAVAAGTTSQVHVSYAPRPVAPAAAPETGAAASAPIAAAPPATAPPLTSVQAPAAPPATAPPFLPGPRSGPPQAPGSPARVSFVPPNGVDTQLSQAVTVSLYAENVTDLVTAAAHLTFDPRIVRVTNIVTGDLPQKNGAQLQPAKNILNDSGVADVSVSRGPNSGGATGSGSLFSITLQAVGRGTTSIAVSGLSLKGPGGTAITSNTPAPLVVNVK